MHPVSEYIHKLPSPEREIADYLHQLFIGLDLKPKLGFGLPFYYGKKWICYIHPLKTGGVELCFMRAHQFEDPTGLLQIKQRKQIKGITIMTLDEIDERALLKILDAAMVLDNERKGKGS